MNTALPVSGRADLDEYGLPMRAGSLDFNYIDRNEKAAGSGKSDHRTQMVSAVQRSFTRKPVGDLLLGIFPTNHRTTLSRRYGVKVSQSEDRLIWLIYGLLGYFV